MTAVRWALVLAFVAGCGGGTPGGRAAEVVPEPAACEPAERGGDDAPRTIAFTGGRWLDGSSFEEKTGYAIGCRLSFRRPESVDSVIDLEGGWVVPPFGEAHNHNVEDSPRVDEVIRSYLEAGVFYVKNPNNLPHVPRALEGKVNVPDGVDVAFANTGITGPGGHPIGVVERNVERGIWTGDEGEGAFYVTVEDTTELARKWDAVLATEPDFIKIYLLYSEAYEAHRDDPEWHGWRGLDPGLVPRIVRRAHRADLPVTAHVETAADFRHAVEAGVDEIAHLPGFRGNRDVRLPDPSVFEIPGDVARLAADRGVVVVTTVGGVRELPPERRRPFDRLHTRNLRLLDRHGVALAIGSDSYDDTSEGEVDYLRQLGVFDDRELLELWWRTGPRSIFPDRRIGRLDEGYEANFLVLGGNPLEDFGYVNEVKLRVKQGMPIELRPAAGGAGPGGG